MSANDRMTERVEEYLALRRAFGYRLTVAGQLLGDFARFAQRTAPGSPLTLNLALRWAQATGAKERRSAAARRLVILRPFARFLQTIEPLTEIPPKGILGRAQQRRAPHIYTDQQLHDLLEATGGLRPCGGLRPRSVRVYLSLLACTGMRPPEPLRLTRDDVDFQTHQITVRETKFSKSRLVVVDPSTTAALEAYAGFRDRHVRRPRSPAFFLLDDASALTHKKALWAFRHLRRQFSWGARPGQRPPRLYDLRHTFVCARLLAWHQAGVAMDVAMPALSTYLGHVKVTDTYWYVTAIPKLMEVVCARFERFAFATDGGEK